MNVKKNASFRSFALQNLAISTLPVYRKHPAQYLGPVHGRRFILRALGIVEEEQLPEGLTRLTRPVIVF